MSDPTPQTPEKNADIAEMTFEHAVEQLERIVDHLEKGDVALDKSIEIYERGEALKRHCETLLNAAENRIEKIRLDRSGKPQGTEPLDEE
ncbi:exodeoxyribonuclease VII small subunit [Pararhizobium mangrovi]|uniref:Exodeoxyribonuclease 7 small subunit n=1 Tax=Pararhizobium mangrovi TaxID=2590452 RepID=A0A506U5U1_9HYPH|nr:exodeoxyribonuclease VII small subunit [Pararhizobium mangrovi]TPW28726.1 exodeoxyribonuclease VII small subunit [Pararhizobium mangrovi]